MGYLLLIDPVCNIPCEGGHNAQTKKKKTLDLKTFSWCIFGFFIYIFFHFPYQKKNRMN